jgi:hypothetical protein
MYDRDTETARRAYTCASPDCKWEHRTIQRGSSYSLIIEGLASYRMHHECADELFPYPEETEDEYENMAESWREHVDKVNYINGR